jgi:hypothetical protein
VVPPTDGQKKQFAGVKCNVVNLHVTKLGMPFEVDVVEVDLRVVVNVRMIQR